MVLGLFERYTIVAQLVKNFPTSVESKANHRARNCPTLKLPEPVEYSLTASFYAEIYLHLLQDLAIALFFEVLQTRLLLQPFISPISTSSRFMIINKGSCVGQDTYLGCNKKRVQNLGGQPLGI